MHRTSSSSASSAPAARALLAAIAGVGLILGLATGCSSKSGKPAAEDTHAAAGDSAAGDTAKPSREQLIADAIQRMGKIQTDLAKLRGKPFKTPVEASFQSADEFRAYVKKQLAEEMPPEKLAATSRAMFHLGFLVEKADLGKLLEDAFVSQAGAYYDPKTKKFHFLMVTENPLVLDIMAAHELAHGLQDQHFDLAKYVQEGLASGLSQDELSARRFIVEGEATLLMMLYPVFSLTGTNALEGPGGNMLRKQIESVASMGFEELIAQQQQQQGALLAEMGPDFAEAAEAMKKIPPFILIPLLEAYTTGALPVFDAFAAGGWAAVDAFYTDPPTSTEQVLHPQDKLIGRRDHPVRLALPAPAALAGRKSGDAYAGWTEIDADVLGELLWKAYFETWSIEDAADAAAGWDGDRYAVYGKGEQTMAIAATTWDSEDDAVAFEAAYLATLAARFPGAEPAKRGDVTALARPDGTLLGVVRRGADVYVADGVPAGQDLQAALSALRKGTVATRHPDDA